ncbi:MAG: hypothetical protein FJ267_14055, partial [Planctomycetes bacterium]|nr:hypothetical protein [Planctomycetota bacterium]
MRLLVLSFAVLLSLPGTSVRAGVDTFEFFEKNIRPVLVERCVKCHGDKKSEAGLRLDHRRGFLKGSDSGAVINKDNIDGSRLMQVIQ